VCAVHADPNEQIGGIAEYFRTGLAQGERCVYILGDRSHEDIQARLTAAGVDVGAALDSGRLDLRTKNETYLPDGGFNPDSMIDYLHATEVTALSAGCNGLRLSGEMTWALDSDTGCDRLIEYETRLNEYFPGSHSLAICQYHRPRFPADLMHGVLRTHPIVIVGQSTCLNPYYEPPSLIAAVSAYAEQVARMLNRLLAIRENELELQTRIRERDEFLSVAWQELRTPLHALNLALSATGHGAALDEISRRNITRAQRQVERLNRLIAAVLDALSIREDRLEWNFGTLELKQLAQVTAAYFEQEAAHLGYTIQVSGESVWGNWDAERIGQVLHNLLSNAVKYGAGKPIEVTVGAHGGFAEIVVTDQGVGINAAQLPYLFDHFGRPSSTQHYTGMGLGLWIVRKLVDAMHGTIEVKSELGEGSCFTVRLPRNRDGSLHPPSSRST
jgi:signal transduction histidine kinase